MRGKLFSNGNWANAAKDIVEHQPIRESLEMRRTNSWKMQYN